MGVRMLEQGIIWKSCLLKCLCSCKRRLSSSADKIYPILLFMSNFVSIWTWDKSDQKCGTTKCKYSFFTCAISFSVFWWQLNRIRQSHMCVSVCQSPWRSMTTFDPLRCRSLRITILQRTEKHKAFLLCVSVAPCVRGWVTRRQTREKLEGGVTRPRVST